MKTKSIKNKKNKKGMAFSLCYPLLMLFLLSSCQYKDRFVGDAPANPYPRYGDVTSSSVVIAWNTVTPATSQVEYGADRHYSLYAGIDNAFTTNHRVSLTSLSPSTVYHFRVKSRNASGDVIFSYDRTFQTASAGMGTIPDDTYLFSFESSAQNWAAQSSADSQAVTAAQASSVIAYNASSQSLMLTMDLRGSHSSLSAGEALVSFHDVDSLREFVSLNNRTISAWIYAPTGAQGDVFKPNGIQLFVKDSSGGSQYGPWYDISNARLNTWFQVSMIVGGSGNAFTSAGFDPYRIVSGGIKVGAGGGSTATYSGPIYIDDVDFL